MKFRHKKIFISGIAATVAGVLGIGALLQTSVSVQASFAMMPGIETIVSETTKDDPFRILEIVDSRAEAEIGWYVSGQEPYIKLYEYTYTAENGEAKKIRFSTLEEGLSKLPTQELREEFADNFRYVKDENGNYVLNPEGNKTVSYDNTGLKNVLPVSYQTGSPEDASAYPLSYEKYMEKYFLNNGDNREEWAEIKFVNVDGSSRIDEVMLKGDYKENPSGKGDYTKQAQTYYPIRNGVDNDKPSDKFRENIQNFYFSEGSGAAAPYYLVFDPVSNSTVNDALDEKDDKTKENTILPEYNYAEGKYGYYENVYVNLTEEIANNLTSEQPKFIFPGENPDKPENYVLIQENILQTAEAFGEGEVKTFTDNTASAADSFGSGTSEEVPQIQEDVPAEDAFSAGDFTDSQIMDDFSGNSSIVDMPESVPQENNSAEPVAAEPTETDTGNAERQPEISFKDPNKDVTASNPYVYLGENIDKFPYYQYRLISDLNTVIDQAIFNAQKDAETLKNGGTIVRTDKDITCKDGQYLYWMMVGNELTGVPLSVVSGRQSVSYKDIQKIPDDLGYDYYFRVKESYFCCYLPEGTDEQKPDNYAYSGWYYPSYPQGEEIYLPAENKEPTHYISDAQYNLTPGTGDYDFIPDDSKNSVIVEVNHLFYKGGYKNNNWLKKDVFNLEPGTADFDKFCIQVDTLTVEELNEQFGTATNLVLSAESSNAENGSAIFSDSQQNGEVQSLLGDDTLSEQTDATQFPEESTGAETEEVSEASEQTNSAEEQEKISEEAVTSEVEPMISEAAETLVAQEITADVFSDSTAQEDTPSPNNNSENIFTSDSSEVFSEGEAVLSEEEVKPAFSAGETQKISPLAEYDLIYINGKLSETSASVIAGTMIPCIINQAKAEAQEAGIVAAFSAFVKNDDTDHHYVSQYVYFFENTFTTIGTVPESSTQADTTASLLNLNFNTNFNPSSTITDETVSPVEGFEEILEYIESENQYRSLGNTNSSEITAGENPSLTPDVELLSDKISQARAIEYIINYKHKRTIKTKDVINVLEIQPAKSSGQIHAKDVLQWYGYNDEQINEDTSSDSATVFEGVTIANVNACCNENGYGVDNILNPDQNSFWHSQWSGAKNGFINSHFGEYHWMELVFDSAVSINSLIYTPRPYKNDYDDNGKITNFSLYFYNEKGEEIGSELNKNIIWNEKRDASDQTIIFSPVKNVKSVKLVINGAYRNGTINKKDNASCAHISFGRAIKSQIKRMTASEYVGHIYDVNSQFDMIYIGDDASNKNKFINGDSQFLYSHVGAKVAMLEKWDALGKYLGQLDSDYDKDTSPDGKQRFAPANTFGENGSGYLRGSGNDMTYQQYEELMEFVKSGYPVVIGDSLISGAKRMVSTDTVDGSSYYYQFMTEALKYGNVLTKAELDSQNNNLLFFTNLAKPVIKFTANGKPLEPPRAEDISDSNSIYGYIDEELRYTFTLGNDSDISPASVTYDCKLYLDLNFDGNLSDKESQDKYITITDSNGNVLSRTAYGEDDNRYELKLGEQYTVTRKIPGDYFKLITWKLEISNNNNPYIHTSETGYAKQKNKGTPQPIKVLQIIPDSGGKWHLGKNAQNRDTRFYNLLEYVKDFAIEIEEIQVSQFAALEDVRATLNNFQILIIGFDDAYQNIPNENGQVNAILDFIRSGKSVIFSHDTTSFQNYNGKEIYPKIAQTKYGEDETINVVKDNWLINTKNNPSWGLSLNNILRSVVGMDRYGITSDEIVDGVTVSSIIKQGRELDVSMVDFRTLMQAAGDIAYKNNDITRSTSYAQTQAYTNGLLQGYHLGSVYNTTSAEKVNDGAITQYPFRMGNSITVSQTHGQYFQLGLEQDKDINGNSDGKTDVVVWYCLSGNDLYNGSPKDARNYYFYYSKGNVIYTGTGHSSVNSDDERKLFINSIVAAANVTAVQPDVRFVKSFSLSAETEKTRYYMTDQNMWTDSAGDRKTLEKDMDFYINVKDYNMISADLSKQDLDKTEMTLEFYIEDERGNLLSEENIPEDIAVKKLTNLNEKYADGGFCIIEYGKESDPVYLSNDRKFHVKDNSVYKFSVKDFEQYLVTHDEQGNQGYRSNCKVYVKVSSTVYLYGEPKTSSTWTSVDLKQRQLFDLD